MICRNHVDVSEGVRRCSRCGGTYCADCLVTIGDRPYCATCKGEQVLDLRAGVDRSRLTLAAPIKRLGAYLIDYVIILFASWAVMLPVMLGTGFFTAAMKGEDPNPLTILLIYIPGLSIPVLYEAIMMVKKNGQTVGKIVLQVRVVRPDGSPITTGQAWGRTLLRLILGCLIILDYIPIFFTEEKTTLHDMIAGTRVIDVI